MRQIFGADGGVAALVDAIGRVSIGRDAGPAVGLVRSDTDVFAGEAGAEWLGRIDADHRVFNALYEIVGTVDASGRVADVTGRIVGRVEAPVDGAALLLLVATHSPGALAPTPPPAETSTVMDEVMSLAAEDEGPHVRKNYKPLTDEDVFGTPHRKP